MISNGIYRALLLLLLLRPLLIRAAEPAVKKGDQASWPQSVVVNVGDVRTRIDGPKMWTLSGLEYQNVVMATQDSAYGTVVTIRNVGHLGTAHFLDVPGKPGEVEKENVTRLEFFVNDKPVTEFSPMMKLTGDAFRMERRSKIRGLDLDTTVSLRDGVLIETARIRVQEAMDLQSAYPWMYAWTSQATHYVFGDNDGIRQRGTFAKNIKYRAEVVKNANWMAVFNAATGKGSVCCFLKHPSDADGWFLLVDAPEAYRKVTAYTLENKIVPKGFDGTWQSAVGFFTATEADWESHAARRATELRSTPQKSDP